MKKTKIFENTETLPEPITLTPAQIKDIAVETAGGLVASISGGGATSGIISPEPKLTARD